MELVARSTVIFFFLWLVTRGIGKRELAEMTAFEMILLVTMGDLIQQGVTQEDTSLTGAMLAIGTIAFWILVTSYLTFRWRGARTAFEGIPVVVVRDGAFVDEAMRLERVHDTEVLESARNEGIERLEDVKLAVLEPDGKFSFIQRDGRGAGQDDQKHKAT